MEVVLAPPHCARQVAELRARYCHRYLRSKRPLSTNRQGSPKNSSIGVTRGSGCPIESDFPGKLGGNSWLHFDLLLSKCRLGPASQPWTPAIKSSNRVLSPRLFSERSPSARTSKGFSASIPGVFRARTRVLSERGLGRVFFLPSLQSLAGSGSSAVQIGITGGTFDSQA